MNTISRLLDRLGEWITDALDVDWGSDDDVDPEAGLIYDPELGICNGDGEAHCVCPDL